MANTNDLPVNSKFNRQRKGSRMSVTTMQLVGRENDLSLNGRAARHTQIVSDFRKELSDDANSNEVIALIGTGYFTQYQERVLNALNQDDWLGFDYPSQAISAAFSGLENFDPSDELRAAINSSN
jgi:hypothetical protein